MIANNNSSIILNTIAQLPYGVGPVLLVDILQGNSHKRAIQRNKLDTMASFGTLQEYSRQELLALVDQLEGAAFICRKSVPANPWIKVLGLTNKGNKAILKPKILTQQTQPKINEDPISNQEQQIITSLDFFLKGHNIDQCRAIISNASRLLCIAGAGSGKTTVLTKRIEFLTKFRSIQPNNILAITFTKKARSEMQHRLQQAECFGIQVHTFNSFCESLLRGPTKQMIQYKDKIRLVNEALRILGIKFSRLADSYFTKGQRRGKFEDKLLLNFVNDCFHVVDHYTLERKALDPFHHDLPIGAQRNAKLLHQVCSLVQQLMEHKHLRSYAHQVAEILTRLEKYPQEIPKFKHILVDEYQDVNHVQIHLLNLLAPKNLFVVGDPRQAIFGWRGSKLEYLFDFKKQYPQAVTVALKYNYRSTPAIVKLANDVVANLGIQPQQAFRPDDPIQPKLSQFSTVIDEQNFVVRQIKSNDCLLHETFILARTNKQLKDMGAKLQRASIPFTVANDDQKAYQRPGHVVLSTVHAIKGLEAQQVFLIGCSSNNFPCKVSDHPVIESLQFYQHDKEAEERRLLYVAVTRAKQHLFISYVGQRPSYFLGGQSLNQNIPSNPQKPDVYQKLKNWRRRISDELSIPPYRILHDKSLVALNEQRPTNKNQLTAIHGLGPVKISKYGDELLALLS